MREGGQDGQVVLLHQEGGQAAGRSWEPGSSSSKEGEGRVGIVEICWGNTGPGGEQGRVGTARPGAG